MHLQFVSSFFMTRSYKNLICRNEYSHNRLIFQSEALESSLSLLQNHEHSVHVVLMGVSHENCTQIHQNLNSNLLLVCRSEFLQGIQK